MNNDDLVDRLEHLETSRVLQGMLTPAMLLLMDYGGPVLIEFEKRDGPPCYLCHQPVYSGERCFVLAVKRLKELMLEDVSSLARELHIHENCFEAAMENTIALPEMFERTTE
jgi:hypothetical protein